MNWRQHLKQADAYRNDAAYADAAYHYEQAWRLKPGKKYLLQRAGDNYLIVRDYEKAAESFVRLKDELNDFPLAGLKYARALKQSGKYAEANQAFAEYLGTYNRADRAAVEAVVQTELSGLELAVVQQQNPDRSVRLNYLAAINTPATEFSPIPFSEDILYYASTVTNRARIYRTLRQNGEWTPSELPGNFPEIENFHYGNGSLSPDGRRFYFTMCESVESWGSLTTRCHIYVIMRSDDGWSDPQKLRPYINQEGATATQPFVMHRDGLEILYFASNRNEGKGGMDIWYCTRNLKIDDIDFTFPKNAGSINTIGDELTPWYDERENAMYFSSNGHPSMGGQDIHRAEGSMDKWGTVENLGLPYNSPAEDTYFIKTPNRSGGFLVSNRLFGTQKVLTTNEDIFEFGDAARDLTVTGNLLNRATQTPIRVAKVLLYEVLADDQQRLLTSAEVTDGKYAFPVLPDRTLRIEVQKDGYAPAYYDFNTTDATVRNYGKDIALKSVVEDNAVTSRPRVNRVVVPRPESDPTTTSAPSVVTAAPATVAASPPVTEEDRKVNERPREIYYVPRPVAGGSDATNYSESDAPQSSGAYYKVQIIAVKRHDPMVRRYDPVRDLGRLDTELIAEKGITRVMLADYFSLEEARSIRSDARRGGFDGAFIVKYENGQRIGRVN